MGKLSTENKKLLITAQKGWQTFRDAEDKLAEIIAPYPEGTISILLMLADETDILKKRTIELYNFYLQQME